MKRSMLSKYQEYGDNHEAKPDDINNLRKSRQKKLEPIMHNNQKNAKGFELDLDEH